MSFTPTNSRVFPVHTTHSLKLTPSANSYNVRVPRSPKKSRSLYESGLSLKRIIGTTVTSPTGFDSLPSSRTFAYTAGAAAVVVTLDDELQYSQKFYRARPTALPIIANSSALAPSTPTTASTANDSRSRAITTLRESGIGYAPSTPTSNTSRDWDDSPSSKTWSSRERIKAATCLSISRDGRFLAVGETGYSPRVLIFSLHESSDQPIAILNEHTFGVRGVAFSPDGRYLASLGNVNDGFLYVWSVNTRTGAARLHSSNKCTSFIKGMVWMGMSLITVGTRHVKVWRVEESVSFSNPRQKITESPLLTKPAEGFAVKTLLGRNSLLGALVDATFTCLAAISERAAIICSDRGDICLLDDSDGQRLMRVGQSGFPITCLATDAEARVVRLGGRAGMTKILSFDDFLQSALPAQSTPPPDDERDSVNASPSPIPSLGPSCLVALAFIDDVLVTVNSQHAIRMFHKEEVIPHTSAAPLTAHHDAVQGVGLLGTFSEQSDSPLYTSAFFTWSASGNILFWDLEGRKQHGIEMDLEQPLSDDETQNQCLVVRASKNAEFFVTGDKLGMLSVIDSTSGTRTSHLKGHNGDILDIAIFENISSSLIVSCSRDRTVQLFRKTDDAWVLIQTMDEHSASVCSVFFCEAGQKLISASTDRTIQIRQLATREINGQEIMAALPIRVITCKAAPVSMVMTCNNDMAPSFVVSMLDRTVATYEISGGRLISSFKATDRDGTEAVAMDALVMGSPGFSSRPTFLAGVSSTDKSVRVYDVDNGAFLDREWGHTAAVTGIALLESGDLEKRTTLISTGSDGTIMIWDLSPKAPPELLEPFEPSNGDSDASPPKETTSARPPLRRVLSKQELAAFGNPSPTTPTGRSSPPRSLRRKTSKYSMSAAQSPKLGPPPVPAVPTSYFSASTDSVATVTIASKRDSPRTRSRSPPVSPRRASRRPSLASLEFRGRTKSAGAGPASEFGSLNMATEQVCRTLRAYRKKLSGNEVIREDALKELDHELRMTAKALGEKTLRNKALSETVLAGLLDQYSERLVSIFDEKLRLSLHPGKSPGTPNGSTAEGSEKEALTPVSEGDVGSRRTSGVRIVSGTRRASARD